MSKINNISKIIGDQNISLQDVNAENITIITGKEENPEVTAKKQEIAEQIAELIRNLDTFKQANKSPKINASEDDFDEIDFDELVNAIKYDNCVLFIGPEISLNKKGESLHENFYESISSKNTNYDKEEGFFMPNSERKLKTKMMTFYNEDFPSLNENGYSLLEKVAQIPFSLVVSSAPDNSFVRILEAHNKKHHFAFYNEMEQNDVPEPQKEKPVIYNFLGYPAEDGKFMFTHQQLHNYINQKQQVKIPTEIEAKVQEAEHFLFIGFNFKRWQNRLALFSFQLETDGYIFSDKKLDKKVEEFLQKQFQISQIQKNYNDFVDVLLQKAHEAGLSESLSEIFFENTLRTLERIRARTMDTTKREQLIDIEEELKLLKNRFF